MRRGILLSVLMLSANGWGQISLRGTVADSTGAWLPYATVALLTNEDSLLVNVSMTGNSGDFVLNNISPGIYILQVAFLGYETHYQQVKTSGHMDLGTFILRTRSYNLKEVNIVGERIPMLLMNDTLVYNASAFKTKPDGVGEDLLKKLPGIEVDRVGNIKAMGEEVRQVLVDGKEFFGQDYKVATKNISAENIEKVELYNKKSDESEFLGLDDGDYEKTLNFVLKEDAKKAWIAEIKAGAGTEGYYQGRAKAFRFTGQEQLAILGMANNVNNPGFSIMDYMNFNGGMRNLTSENQSGTQIVINDDLPPGGHGMDLTGFLTLAGGGLNYSLEKIANNRINFSYMGNGSWKEEEVTTFSKNLTADNIFEQTSNEKGKGNDANHLFNIGWRNKAAKDMHFILNATASFQDSKTESDLITEKINNGVACSLLNSDKTSSNDKFMAGFEGSFLKKISDTWQMFRLSNKFRYTQTLKESDWNNLTRFPDNENIIIGSERLKADRQTLSDEIKVSALRRLGSGYYLEPSIAFNYQDEKLDQTVAEDTLKYNVLRNSYWVRPGFLLKKYNTASKLFLGFFYQAGNQQNKTNKEKDEELEISYFLPYLMWENEYKKGRRLTFLYQESIVLPLATQLIPVIDISNPFIQYFGNPGLKPENRHSADFSWMLYDQFSFTSFFGGLDFVYTHNKISDSMVIDDSLNRKVSLVNVPKDYTVSLYMDFKTPLRFIGANISLGINEKYNKGIAIINGNSSTNRNYTHSLELKLDNRNKTVWDVETGGRISLTQSKYSLHDELNNNYKSFSAFGEMRYSPNDFWHFRFSADYTGYDAGIINKSIKIPLISTEINYYIKGGKKAMLSLEIVDILNKNTGISRESGLNFIIETHSSTIGRYAMLSLRYKINKADERIH